MKKKRYTLTEEHRAKLKPWADKWTANALRCGEYTETDRRTARRAVNGLYRAADLMPPRRITFCQSPISAAIAAGVAAGVIWIRKNPDKHMSLFGRRVGDSEALACIAPACGHTVRHGITDARSDSIETAKAPPLDSATASATYSATRSATASATASATDLATYSATYSATASATESATASATASATDSATDSATASATDLATYSATELSAVTRFLIACAARALNMRQGGNHWSGWTAYLSFFRHVAKLNLPVYDKWRHWETLTKFGPRFVHEDFCIVSEWPEFIRRDAENRPHSETGPFCRWRDGWALYYWHGVKVPAAWIERKQDVDPALALTWSNIEQRRCLAEILGWSTVIERLSPRVIDADPDPMIGTLLEVDLPDSPKEKFLRVRCGTGRDFCLPVDQAASTALEANAASFEETDLASFRNYLART